LVTSPQEYARAQFFHQNDIAFRVMVQAILDHLNIPPGDLGGRLHLWGARDFQTDYLDPNYVRLLNCLRVGLQHSGGLTPAGLVTPDTIN
jgi:hypothetical protein